MKLSDRAEPQAKQRNLYFKDVKDQTQHDEKTAHAAIITRTEFGILLNFLHQAEDSDDFFPSSLVFPTRCRPHNIRFMQYRNRFAGSCN